MKLAILGAGVAGLTAAYELNKQGHEVWIFEKESAPGGAASGFKLPSWDWYLDYSYHHWFTNDLEVLGLAREIGFNDIIVKRPITASLYPKDKSNIEHITYNKKQHSSSSLYATCYMLYQTLFGSENELIKLDSALDLLRFNRLSLFNRLRMGAVLALLKFGPKFKLYDTINTEDFLQKTMGKAGYNAIWRILMEKKFPDGLSNRISAAFIWTRVQKRSESLVYPVGGFQAFCNHFAALLIKKGVKIKYGCEVKSITTNKNNIEHIAYNKNQISSYSLYVTCYMLHNYSPFIFDAVINTLPSPLFLSVEKNVLPVGYREQLSRIEYLGSQNVILQTAEPILSNNIYWLNILDRQNPWTVAVQHTNFMDKAHFGNKHLLYLGRYAREPLKNSKFKYQMTNQIQSSNDKNNLNLEKLEIGNSFIKYAQPLYTTEYTKIMPDYITPVTGLYFANLELSYPHDRGTNYAVKVGKEVVKKIRKNSAREGI